MVLDAQSTKRAQTKSEEKNVVVLHPACSAGIHNRYTEKEWAGIPLGDGAS
jgi:hypothetical protein